MPIPAASPHNPAPSKKLDTFFSRLTPDERVRIAEILSGWGLLPEEHEEYVEILVGHLKIALDGYLSRFKTS